MILSIQLPVWFFFLLVEASEPFLYSFTTRCDSAAVFPQVSETCQKTPCKINNRSHGVRDVTEPVLLREIYVSRRDVCTVTSLADSSETKCTLNASIRHGIVCRSPSFGCCFVAAADILFVAAKQKLKRQFSQTVPVLVYFGWTGLKIKRAIQF